MKDKKTYYIVSGLNLNDNNRGTAALGYGSFLFLKNFYNTNDLTVIRLFLYKKPWRFNFKGSSDEVINIDLEERVIRTFYIWFVDYWIYKNIPFLSRLTKIYRILKKVSFVAAINGGDGFSDIYNTKTFEGRLFDINLAMKEQIPLILLPQTLGPFKEKNNFDTAAKILKYSSKIYVRDLKFESELIKMKLDYELTKDLSFYMVPEKFDIDIKPNAVGLNVSGLCYSNRFKGLTGYFDYYPQLIDRIITYFQDKNVPLYLVSHSYNYKCPENANDDMQAAREAYSRLTDKSNAYLIDKDLTSPQIKYVISQFDFFIGTRMHSNFAAIFTNVPVFGLAYSYKYEGSFNYMGLKGYYASVLNLEKEDIDDVLFQIAEKYKNIESYPFAGYRYNK
ncbi:polysaccharide pyruvyl transferase family protein [uncultured Desulfobacter sp.]|uniref:polysaccharide pyruvyl transferase family protein n=1 Tax=uncultured Desulfobacter sp. TaxID=240139 RepID=UPI002AA69AA0|nr:polysaccharide pyruvyl transferase family protein [uncultured Desulfobacter sp.]